jgi:hypothetical protein
MTLTRTPMMEITGVEAFWTLMGVAVIPFVEMERPMVLREKRNASYKMLPYVLAHFVCIMLGSFILAFTSSIINVFMAGLLGFGNFLLILWMCCLFAECFAYFVSALFPHFIIGLALMASFFGLCIALQGFFQVLSQMSWVVRWMAFCTPHRYAFRAFMRNEFATISQPFLASDGQVAWTNGTAVLAFYGLTDEGNLVKTIGGDIGILFAFSCSYILLFYLVCEFYWR